MEKLGYVSFRNLGPISKPRLDCFFYFAFGKSIMSSSVGSVLCSIVGVQLLLVFVFVADILVCFPREPEKNPLPNEMVRVDLL